MTEVLQWKAGSRLGVPSAILSKGGKEVGRGGREDRQGEALTVFLSQKSVRGK